jgi:hypothetical protein
VCYHAGDLGEDGEGESAVEAMFSVTDVQHLYQQWQDGKLLDNEERQALRRQPVAESAADAHFADILKSVSESSASN